ncbi:MAG: molybdopterin-binding protein [Lachnospiraceae bacterium]|nr:molybdopterin-binding protein [Lachnospiraceae bacterium]
MKLIRTEDAVGTVLCHDITQIIKGVTKDAVFRKGHIVREEDIPVLLSCGKENLYVWECDENMLHENEAADFLCDLCQGANLRRGNVKEGKLEIFAECDGLLKVDEAGVLAVNSAGEMMIASRHGNFPVKAGDKVAGTRIIPLVIEKEKLTRVKDRIRELQEKPGLHEKPAFKEKLEDIRPLYNVLPFKHKRAAIIATGSEIRKGIIEDTFTPVVEAKLAEYDTGIVYKATPGDEHELITKEIMKAINEYNADIVLCTGGMSVDPDDRTPLAIRNTGARIVCYGAPVLPGAMFMLGYLDKKATGNTAEGGSGAIPGGTDDKTDGKTLDKVAIMGLPGCVMFHGRTIFDLILPRIMADDEVFGEEIAAFGTGGLCLNCETCTFPNCGFGK